MNTPEQSQLGKSSAYVDQYDASLLFPIPRSGKRAEIGITGAAPFFGADLWTAFELSWLNLRGKPQVALAHITVPCETPNIVESKSFKLYLNSFNNTRFADAAEVQARIRADISEAAWRGAEHSATVGVRLIAPELFDQEPAQKQLPGDRPARRGQCADQLQRPADQPGRAAAVPGELSQPQRVPRAVRGAHLHGCVDALQTHQTDCVRALHAPGRAGHQPAAHQPPARSAAQRAHGTAVGPAAVSRVHQLRASIQSHRRVWRRWARVRQVT